MGEQAVSNSGNKITLDQKRKIFNRRYLKEISSLGIRSSSYLVLSDRNDILKAGSKGWEQQFSFF